MSNPISTSAWKTQRGAAQTIRFAGKGNNFRGGRRSDAAFSESKEVAELQLRLPAAHTFDAGLLADAAQFAVLARRIAAAVDTRRT